MNLKNGYKVMYEVIEGSERVFLASKSGLFADADEIARFALGSYKVVYQRGSEFFGIDAEGVETRLEAFDAIFVESVTDVPTEEEEEVETPTEEPEATTDTEEEIPTEGTEEV